MAIIDAILVVILVHIAYFVDLFDVIVMLQIVGAKISVHKGILVSRKLGLVIR